MWWKVPENMFKNFLACFYKRKCWVKISEFNMIEHKDVRTQVKIEKEKKIFCIFPVKTSMTK